MKTKVLIIFFVSILISCEKEEKDEQGGNFITDSEILVGEWCRSYGQYVYDITFTSNLKLTGKVYENLTSNPKLADNISGSWSLYSYGSELSISYYWASKNESDNAFFYSVKNWSHNYLQLVEKQYSNEETFIRVVESKALSVGNVYDIEYLKTYSISALNISSSNTSIIKADSDGKVSAIGRGIAFVTITTINDKMIVKFEVE